MSEEIKKNKTPIDPVIFEPGAPLAPKEEPKKKPIRPAIFEAPVKSFEDKTYLVLIANDTDDDLSDGNFKICHGRTDCYRFIETLLESYGDSIDIHKSIVMTETRQTETETGDIKYYMINIPECVSMYSFCKSVESYYGEYGFDIEGYNKGYSQEEIEDNKLVDPDPDKEALYGTFAEFLKLRDHNIKETFSDTQTPFIEGLDNQKKYDFNDGNGINV